jgi:peptidoglycan hydrolase CwlO-like protein
MEKLEILQMALATIESKDKRIEKLQKRIEELEKANDRNLVLLKEQNFKICKLESVCNYLNNCGGLGLEKHELIENALGKND